ncbi:hypothetical protein GCM10023187_49300 [Nibrella viscosa]|uniref:Glyoxalase/fosfomycin resistance/dioxygenase domain-containing protein n=1 Tax=Nibrella viscosa TaxID=1084524 RepID=A0ABP8KWJ6_9BACT
MNMAIKELSIKGIDHPAVAANDVETLADWYCTMFGYEKWFHHPKPVWLLKAPDGSLLEIIPKDDTARPMRTFWTPGWSHLALKVDNIDDAIAFLDSKGVVWGGEIVDAIGGGRVRNLFDPDGNMLQILERL